jgi:hypothetical protein
MRANVLSLALFLSVDKKDTKHSKRATKVMRTLGYVPKVVTTNGRQHRAGVKAAA